jgi:phosphoglycolate phosphatase (TIGR01487 family)
MNSPKVAVVSDYDRTLACESDGFRIREDVSEAVNEFSRKHVFIVASGREEKIIRELAPNLRPTVWVLENGAKLVFQGRTVLLSTDEWMADRDKILSKLSQLGIEYSVGEVIIYVNGGSRRIKEVLEAVKGLGHAERNRSDVMILPKGVNKANGVLRALKELNFEGKIYAVGDSENDLSLFEIADVKVAVANALDEVKRAADIVLDKPNGLGVKELLEIIYRNEETL